MEADNIDDIYNIQSNQLTIGEGISCHINRKLDTDLNLLAYFEDAIPKYSPENGPHIEIKQKRHSKPTIIPLNNSVCNGMLIPNAKDMDHETFYSAFVEKKKAFVNEWIIKQTFAMGYTSPSPVQALAIPELIQRRDSMIQFKSGTGKTWAFLFGFLWGFDPDDPELQYIFITISHEVAVQIYEQAISLVPKNTKIVLCIGQKKDNTTVGFKTPIGTSSLSSKTKTLREEREELQKAQIIVCTIGKFYDFLCNRHWIPTRKYLKGICVDEFDNIVASKPRPNSSTIMSTEEQMGAIMREIPEHAQRAFFSATVTPRALELAYSYFRTYSPSVGEPFIVLLNSDDYTLDGIKQYYVLCESYMQKKDVLLDLLKQCRIAQGIIFANRIETANDVKNFMDEQAIPISSQVFHAKLSGTARQAIHRDFMSGKVRLLISTDVTSRGIDVHGINVVINFDMPDELPTYIHRVGRSGRFGRKGVAISLVLDGPMKNETEKIEEVNKCSKSRMETLPNDLANLLA